MVAIGIFMWIERNNLSKNSFHSDTKISFSSKTCNMHEMVAQSPWYSLNFRLIQEHIQNTLSLTVLTCRGAKN
jgi:hypothetical protein